MHMTNCEDLNQVVTVAFELNAKMMHFSPNDANQTQTSNATPTTVNIIC